MKSPLLMQHGSATELTVRMSQSQQQNVFEAAVKALQQQPDAAAVAMAQGCCLLAARLKMPHSSEQLQQLVDVLLAAHQNQEAYTALKQAGQHTVLPAPAVAATLTVALKRDFKKQDSGMSAMTSDLLLLWKRCALAAGTHQLTAGSASMLTVLLTRDKRWSEAAGVFQSCVRSNQVVTEQMWNCAVIACDTLGDQKALYKAWSWIRAQGHGWIPSLPSSHASLLLSITALHSQPSQGAALLTAQHSHYGTAPSLQTCEEVIRVCNQRMAEGSISTDCQDAVWRLLQQMHKPVLPEPTLNTFVLAAQSVLPDLSADDGVPLHHSLVLLQQNVWSRMHHTVGSGPDTLLAYASYLTALSNSVDVAAETVQTVLLMAQNGLAGISSAACVALAFNLNDLLMQVMSRLNGCKIPLEQSLCNKRKLWQIRPPSATMNLTMAWPSNSPSNICQR